MVELQSPCVITSRLCAGLHVRDSAGLCEISIEASSSTDHLGKPNWRWHIDLPDGTHHTAEDLAGWGDHRAMLGALVSFLAAAAEAYDYEQRTGTECENRDLFPASVCEWASSCSDELSLLGLELEGE